MRMGIKDRIAERITEEKLLLRDGNAPPPRIKNRIQRTVVKLLAGFLAIMLVFTIVSRVANGITIARVKTDTVKSGTLTNRTTIEGQLAAEGDISISLPAGLRVEASYAKVGQQVSAGDALLLLDMEEICDKLEVLRKEIQILELRLKVAKSGVSGASANAIIAAQEELDNANREYLRLLERQEIQNTRSDEDYAELVAALEKANADYDKISQKVRENLIKAAEDAAAEAEENLKSVQEAAEDSIRQAEQLLNQAANNLGSAESAYYRAFSAYTAAKAELDKAKQSLADLEAAEEPNAALIAAAKEAVTAAQAAFDAASNNLDAQSYSSADYDYAKQNLATTKSRCEKNIQKAKDALAKAEEKLSAEKSRTDYSDEAEIIAAQSAINAAEQAIKSADRSSEDSEYSQETELMNAQKAIDTAKRNLENAKENSADDAVARAQAEIDCLNYEKELAELRKQLTLLESAFENDGIVSASVDGAVLKTMDKGAKIEADADAVTISRSDQGFVFEGSVTKKAAELLSVGTKGWLTYTQEGRSQRVEAEITAISSPDENGNVAVTARLPAGSYPAGASGSMTITEKSETHYSCLPLTALRTGANGDYVLVLREKSAVMGTEWTVVAVPVTVKDKDSELMSVESSLFYDDRVVISSNKPISEGDRVRLES